MKTAKSSLARAHRGGRPGVPGVRTRDPHHGLGGPCTRKSCPGLGSNSTHSSHNTQSSFDPPPPRHPPHPPPQKGVPGYGGVKGSKTKNSLGIIFSPKMMILQGVGHPVPYLGVSYANDPQKGGYMAYAPTLDLTTLFEVIYTTSYANMAIVQTKVALNDEILSLQPGTRCQTRPQAPWQINGANKANGHN